MDLFDSLPRQQPKSTARAEGRSLPFSEDGGLLRASAFEPGFSLAERLRMHASFGRRVGPAHVDAVDANPVETMRVSTTYTILGDLDYCQTIMPLLGQLTVPKEIKMIKIIYPKPLKSGLGGHQKLLMLVKLSTQPKLVLRMSGITPTINSEPIMTHIAMKR
jgi:hypothetical protein